MCYEMIELKEGEPVVFLGVHALRWNWEQWGEPKVGFVDCDCDQQVEELQAENERLFQIIQNIYDDIPGPACDALHDAGVFDDWLELKEQRYEEGAK